MPRNKSVVALTAAVILGVLGGYALGKTAYPPLDVLLESGTTIINQEIKYPAGSPKVTAAVVTIKAGDSTGWHHHDAPLFAWVLEGSLTVDYGSDGSRTYKKGDAFLEAFRSRHNGINSSGEDVRILTVYMGGDGVSNVVVDGN